MNSQEKEKASDGESGDVPLGGLRVGVICNLAGGSASSVPDDEAELDSPATVKAIAEAISAAGAHACIIEADASLASRLREHRIDIAFNIAEGKTGRGREAQAPALLNMLGIPFVGSDETALCVALDKAMCKRLVSTYGVRTPKYVLAADADALKGFGCFPAILKPNAEGSGKGISEASVADSEEELLALAEKDFALYGEEMLCEEFVSGREFTVGVLGNGSSARVFEPMEIVYSRPTQKNYTVYSYKVKKDYKNYVTYSCPAELSAEQNAEMKRMTLAAFTALGCRDFSRADFRMSESGEIYFIEINPLPGLAPGYSDYPMLAEANGVEYGELVRSVLRAAVKRTGVKPAKPSAADKASTWQWQFAHRITTADALAKVLPLTEEEKADISLCLRSFRMAITPYYASLINPEDKDDPIRAQCVPSIKETYPCGNDLADPLNEEGDSPVPHIVHRYPDRVLLLVTCVCSMYCRHCTRRRVVGEEDRVITEKQFSAALAYIRAHKEIRDVLISGGDPLTMSTPKLEHIISSLRAIDHVEIVRIGTRVPVVMPMRIDDELINMLKKYQPIWINTHFNHPRELTAQAAAACAKIIDAGIPLGNQTVLLRGVNDNPETMKKLMLGLVKMRVRPYYLYQCDLSRGISHFRTDVRTGITIMRSLQGYISGYAVPKYVIDAPGGGGKIPIDCGYTESIDDDQVRMTNYLGLPYNYPQAKVSN